MDPSERARIIHQGRQLVSEHQEHVKKAALELDAPSQWKRALNGQRHERYSKEWILRALQSENVPDQLQWENFARHYGGDFITDREIMLQRLELESFETQYKNSAYKIPASLRDDKEVMLKIVSKSSSSLIHASDTLQNDRDVILAAIQNEQPCAPMAIKHASKKLQGDKNIARVLLGHGYGIKALSLLSRSIQQDCNLVLQAIQWSSDECNESYETLSELAEEMLDDYDIVYEAVKRRGSNLQYVTDKSLLEDIDIVMAACESDGGAIQYVPKCPARDEMLEEHNLIVLIENGGHCVLKELNEEYIMDRKYLIVAVKNGMVVPEDISLKLYEQDRSLFNDVLRHSNKPFQQYESFPQSIHQDTSVGTAIFKTNTSFDEGSWAFQFAKDIPEDEMANNMEPLVKMAKLERYYSPRGNFSDVKSIVVSLCNIDGDFFAHASTRLRGDVDVAKAAFGSSQSVFVHTIKKCPQSLFQANHDVAALAILACRNESLHWRDRDSLFNHFGPQTTACETVFLAWIKKGWPIRDHYGRSLPFANDHSVIIEALKTGGSVSQIFAGLPSHLRENKEFMLKAVEANPEVIKFASQDLLDDFDFLLCGIAGSKASLLSFSHKEKDFDLIADFAAEVRDRRFLVDTIVLHFFGSISIGGNAKPAKRRRTGRKRDCRPLCQLHLLDIGGEGGEWIKRAIADFAGIPVGPDLKLYSSALENLEYWGY